MKKLLALFIGIFIFISYNLNAKDNNLIPTNFQGKYITEKQDRIILTKNSFKLIYPNGTCLEGIQEIDKVFIKLNYISFSLKKNSFIYTIEVDKSNSLFIFKVYDNNKLFCTVNMTKS